MAISYVTMMRDDDAPRYKFAEVKHGKIVSINEHWVPLEQFVTFFNADALFIDITDVTVNGETPAVGDTVVTNESGYKIIHDKSVFSPAEYRAYMVEMMRLTRDKKELEPIELTVNGVAYMFDADEDANVRISKARQLLEDNNIPFITWTTFDNEHVDITVDDFKAINTAQAIRSSELHVRYNKLKNYIYNLADDEVGILNDFTWDSEIGE